MDRYRSRERLDDHSTRSYDGGHRGSSGRGDYGFATERKSRNSSNFHSDSQSGSGRVDLARSNERKMAEGYPGRKDDFRTPVKRRRSSEKDEYPAGPRKCKDISSVGSSRELEKMKTELSKVKREAENDVGRLNNKIVEMKKKHEEIVEDFVRERRELKEKIREQEVCVKERRELKEKVQEQDAEIAKLEKKALLKRTTIVKTENLEERNRKLCIENEEVKVAHGKSVKDLVKMTKDKEELEKIIRRGKDDLRRIREERDALRKDVARKIKIQEERDGKIVGLERELLMSEHKLDNLAVTIGEAKTVVEVTDGGTKGEGGTETDDEDVLEGDNREVTEDVELVGEGGSTEVEVVLVDSVDKSVAGGINHDVEGFVDGVAKDLQGVDGEVGVKKSVALTNIGNFMDDDIVLPSDEEFASEEFVVNGYDVSNYKDVRVGAGEGLVLPPKYYSGKFKPGITALNNQVIFAAAGTYKMGNLFPGAGCNLKPHCRIKWNVGDFITRVFVFSSPSHPKNEQEVWVCLHHGTASLDRIQLQVQKMHVECRVVASFSGIIVNKNKVEDNVESTEEKITDVVDNDGPKSPIVPRTRNKAKQVEVKMKVNKGEGRTNAKDEGKMSKRDEGKYNKDEEKAAKRDEGRFTKDKEKMSKRDEGKFTKDEEEMSKKDEGKFTKMTKKGGQKEIGN